MALQCWFPLNGNLNNQGISSCNVTPTTTPVYVDGKLGKAMSTGGFYLPATEVAKFYNNNAMSFCFWIYVPTETTGGSYILGADVWGNRLYTIYQYPTANDLHLSWQDNGQTATFLTGMYEGVLESGKWTHVAITYNGAGALIYINGVYRFHASGVSARTDFTLDVHCPNSPNRYIQDIRIYDHVLSDKEVKAIARGMVIHYPLGSTSSYNENLVYYINTEDNIDAFHYSEAIGNSTNTIEYDNGIPCVKVTRDDTPHDGWQYLYQSRLRHNRIKTNTYYTISFDIIADHDGDIYIRGFWNGNATNQMCDWNSYRQPNYTSGKWTHIVLFTHTKESFEDISVGGQVVYMWCGNMATINRWIMVKNFKVEEGLVDTPWCPAPIDDAYTAMGYDSTVEYDASGYGNHGTRVGNLSQVTDSKKYLSATSFDGYSYIQAPAITLDMSKISFSIWGNWSEFRSWSRLFDFSEAQEGAGYAIMSANAGRQNKLATCGRREGGASLPDQNNVATLELNTWYHIVVTINGTICKTYVNGELVNTFELGGEVGMAPFNYNYLGKSNWAADYLFSGKMSDFRVYATTLTEADVKELYQTSASIDKKGNLYCLEFIEQ